MSNGNALLRKSLACVVVLLVVLLTATIATAAYVAKGRNHLLGNWVINNGAFERSEGNMVFTMYNACIGLPVIGYTLSKPRIINNIPTYESKILIGFLFVNWYEEVSVDDNYDIVNLACFQYKDGPEITEQTWTGDADPYFTWNVKRPDLVVEGYSYAFDDLPDKFVDTVDAFYQAPDMYLSEGEHSFYVIAKNPNGSFGNVSAFELWVDLHEPTIADTLPADGDVLKDPQPIIQGTVMDLLSGIKTDSITLRITTEKDTYDVLPTYDRKTGIVTYQPPEPLDDGLVTIFMSVQDKAGNESVPLFWTFTIDTQSPMGSVVINNGAAATDSNAVTLKIEAVETGTAVESMMISNDGNFANAAWEPYVSERANWFLDPTAGVKTVYVKFRDAAANESPVYHDSIVLTVASPNTYIMSGPSTITQSTSAQFVFMATEAGSSFYYKLDNGEWIGPQSETDAAFSDLSVGNHYFQVKAGIDLDSNGTIDADEIDMTPAIVSWSIGTLNPASVYSERPIKSYERE